MVAAGDLDETRPAHEATGGGPLLPPRFDDFERNGLVRPPHHDTHRNGGRLLIGMDPAHLVEERAVDRRLAVARVVENLDRIARTETGVPAVTDADCRSDQ